MPQAQAFVFKFLGDALPVEPTRLSAALPLKASHRAFPVVLGPVPHA
jgi:hypothetical protein